MSALAAPVRESFDAEQVDAEQFDTAPRRLSFGGVVKGEWIKLTSLRSTWWTLAILVVAMVGFALLLAAVFGYLMDSGASGGDAAAQAQADAELATLTGTTVVTAGYQFAALIVGVLGALAATGEYATGQIRSTLAAVPRRLPVLWAKALVVAGVAVVASLVSVALAWAATVYQLSQNDLSLDFGDAGQVRALYGTALYMGAVALFGLAVGFLLRHTAGTIVTIAAVFFVLPTIFAMVATLSGAQWAITINKWLPSAAGERIITAGGTPSGELGTVMDLFGAWQGFGVFVAYTAVLVAAAAIVLKRRDA